MHRRKFTLNLGLSLFSIRLLPNIFSILENQEQNFLIGKSKSTRFQKIESHFLEEETAKQFIMLQKAALNDGIEIQIASAFRSFKRQKLIFETKLKALHKEKMNNLDAIHQVINYSSIPGTSRHHWGTDLDLIEKKQTNKHVEDLLSEKHYQEGGRFNKLHLWLKNNAARYGFYLAYTNQEERTGYLYEPWHYSYLPSSKKYLDQYLKLDIVKIIKEESIFGLENLDDDFFENYISNYVLGINPTLK